ncbi:MAG: hypothetical protein ACK521_06040 [bacterium]
MAPYSFNLRSLGIVMSNCGCRLLVAGQLGRCGPLGGKSNPSLTFTSMFFFLLNDDSNTPLLRRRFRIGGLAKTKLGVFRVLSFKSILALV